jgi:hypothetical protein
MRCPIIASLVHDQSPFSDLGLSLAPVGERVTPEFGPQHLASFPLPLAGEGVDNAPAQSCTLKLH